MNLQTVTRRAPALGDIDRFVRSMIPRSSRRESHTAARVLGAIALLSIGALAALMLSPKNGPEMRTLARKQVTGLRKRAKEFAKDHELPVWNGRGTQSESPRSRRESATS